MNSPAHLAHRGIALAALLQAADLVHRLASHGQIPDSSFLLMRDTLFRFDVATLSDIYLTHENLLDIEAHQLEIPAAIRQNLHAGLRIYEQIFEKDNSREYGHCIRYCMALIQLEKHFHNHNTMQNQVRTSLENLSKESLSDTEINAAISELYVDSLATLPFRIQILGKVEFLKNTRNEHRIRVLLFAGLRAAMLWRQSGGRRWHFLFAKGSVKEALRLIKTS